MGSVTFFSKLNLDFFVQTINLAATRADELNIPKPEERTKNKNKPPSKTGEAQELSRQQEEPDSQPSHHEQGEQQSSEEQLKQSSSNTDISTTDKVNDNAKSNE